MADTIVETIAAEAKRSSSDSLNPFVSPGSYSANLSSCSFGFGDVRQTWCTDLVAVAGPYNAASGNEVRSVNVFVDGNGNLMVNVSLVAEGGNVTANSSRNIRP
jgi:hypothetical protein